MSTTRKNPDHADYVFRLYLPRRNGKTDDAERKLRAELDRHFGKDYQLEVIDIMENPDLMKRDQIMAVPTLIKKAPDGERRVVGALDDVDAMLKGIDAPKIKS